MQSQFEQSHHISSDSSHLCSLSSQSSSPIWIWSIVSSSLQGCRLFSLETDYLNLLLFYFWGNQSTWRKPTHTEECANSAQTDPRSNQEQELLLKVLFVTMQLCSWICVLTSKPMNMLTASESPHHHRSVAATSRGQSVAFTLFALFSASPNSTPSLCSCRNYSS